MTSVQARRTAAPTAEGPEVLLREAKRRSHLRRGGLVLAILAAAGLVALGLSWTGPSKPTFEVQTRGSAGPLAWQRARTRCQSEGMRLASHYGTDPAMVGAYPTTVRAALSWPPPAPANASAFSSEQPAQICLFRGSFRAQFVCPSYDQSCHYPNETDMIVWLGTPNGPLESVRDAFPRAPIPLSG